MRRCVTALACLVLLAPILSAESETTNAGFWPQWRGPLASGAAPGANPPVTWSETENLRWKLPIPGRGHGSPVIWGNLVFLLTAVPVDLPPAAGEVTEGDQPQGVMPSGPIRLTVLAIDRTSGEVVWERVAREEVPHEGTHTDGSWASASAATDGEVLIAHFGSRGLYAYDLEGELLWSTDLGDMETRRGFGEGGTPLLTGETLIVNWDHEGDSFIVALDRRTGREIWRQSRGDSAD